MISEYCITLNSIDFAQIFLPRSLRDDIVNFFSLLLTAVLRLIYIRKYINYLISYLDRNRNVRYLFIYLR